METQSEANLSDDELELMERRSRAASPGPWISFVVGRDLEAGLNCIEVGYCGAIEVLGATIADQDFIANAREDIPRLISEVKRLRAAMGVYSMLLARGSARSTASVGGAAATVTC